MATKTTRSVATPWGDAAVIEEAAVPQRAGERTFHALVQLLEGPGGDRFVRFAYTTDGVARRGPLTLRVRELQKLRAKAAAHPGLAEALGIGGGA